MSRKRHTPVQIIGKLREVEVGLANGQTVLEVRRTLGITEQSSATNCSTERSFTRSKRPRC